MLFALNLVNVVIILGRGLGLGRAVAVQRIHATEHPKSACVLRANTLFWESNIPVRALCRHSDSLPAGIGGFEELAQFFLENLQSLRTRCVGHAQDRAPKVERVSDIGGNAHQD